MKRFILPVLILFCYPLFAQTPDPGMMPRWGRFKDYLQNGTMTFTYKTLTSPTITGTVTNTGTNTWSGTGTFSTTLKVVGNSAATNFYAVSDADSFKVRMFKYLYPIEMEIGNVQKFAVDSSGNAIFAGTVSAAAFSPTAGNMTVIDIDSVATAGGANRWLKITVSKAGATGIPVSYWVPADTATVK